MRWRVKNMASTVNKVSLLGNVGKDPEIRTSQSGTQVATFSLATQRKVKENVTTQWHNCVVFGKLAEIVQKYVVKGSKLYVDGTIDYSQYLSDGVTKYVTKIIVNELSLLSSKNDNQDNYQKPDDSTPALDEYAPFDDTIPF